MSITLTTSATKMVVLIPCLLVATAYLGLASSNYAAFRLSRTANEESLQRAIRLQPGNAGYHYQLGQYYWWTQRPQEAADSYRIAAQLNPHESEYWLRLASADYLLGILRERRDALQNAIAVNPKDPKVAWVAGNFFISEGDNDSALREFRIVLESSPALSAGALELSWQIRPNVNSLLRGTIPPNAESYSSFFEFLLSKGEDNSAAEVWARMVELRQPVRLGIVFDYYRYLIGRNQPAQAGAVWQQAGDVSNLKDYQPSPQNLIANASFESPILNAGFDWTYEKRPDITLELDPTQPFSGSRSLLISYDSVALDDSGIRHAILVEPNTTYRFSAYFKTQNMEGAGGPHFLLQDFYSEASLFNSEELKGSADWRQVSGEFKTGSGSRLLTLRIPRVPNGSPIRGKLWIDDIRLQPTEENTQ